MNSARVLLIDDDELVLIGLSEELRAAGYRVTTALSGPEAVEKLSREQHDIVFTDLVMPEMDGVTVCKEIKKIYPAAEVVLISGHPKEIERKHLDFIHAGGRDEFLRKPLLDREIVDVTEKVLGERKSH